MASSARIAAHSASTAATSRTAVVPKLNSRNAAAKHQRIAAVTASEVERPPNSSNVSAPEPNTRSTTTNSTAPATTATTNEIRVRRAGVAPWTRATLGGAAHSRGKSHGTRTAATTTPTSSCVTRLSPNAPISATASRGSVSARSATRTSRTTRRTRAPSPQP